MAEKLTPEKIEEIAKNYEKIIEGKVPVIKGQKETVTEKIDPKLLREQKKINCFLKNRRVARSVAGAPAGNVQKAVWREGPAFPSRAHPSP